MKFNGLVARSKRMSVNEAEVDRWSNKVGAYESRPHLIKALLIRVHVKGLEKPAALKDPSSALNS